MTTSFTLQWRPSKTDIDHYGHVNNSIYVKQLETTAWAHSNALGLGFKQYQQLDAGMVITHHDIHYLYPVWLDDIITCCTHIIECDGKLRLSRGFEFRNQHDQIVLRARTDFACITLSTGKPRRMPSLFAETYGSVCVTETST